MSVFISFPRLLRLAAGLMLAQTLLVGGAMTAARGLPRGEQVAFVSGSPDQTSIYLLELTSGLAARLTGANTHPCCLSWSPDGNRLAYVEEGEHPALYALNLNCITGECAPSQPLLHGVEPYVAQWSPDGKHIAFESKKELGYWTIYVMAADGGNKHPISQPRLNAHWPTWSPDGEQIGYTAVQDGRMEMFVVGSSGQNLRRILSDSVKYLYQYTAWSPDGHSLAYVSNQTGRRDLYLIDAQTYRQKPLTRNMEVECCLAWSPDGKTIIFAARPDEGTAALYELALDTGSIHRLTDTRFDASFPAWRPDSFGVQPPSDYTSQK
jgi:Tol biopolymer transport system component